MQVKAERRDVLVQIEEEADDEENEFNELPLAKNRQILVLENSNLIKLVLSIEDTGEMRGVSENVPRLEKNDRSIRVRH